MTTTAKPEPCALCGLPLGAARLHVNGGQEAPSGDFHLRADENTQGCFEKACAEFDRTSGRAGPEQGESAKRPSSKGETAAVRGGR